MQKQLLILCNQKATVFPAVPAQDDINAFKYVPEVSVPRPMTTLVASDRLCLGEQIAAKQTLLDVRPISD